MKGGGRKRILMLCFYYTPSISGGVERSAKYARYLPESGWDPIVVTTRRWGGGDGPSGERVIRTREILRDPFRRINDRRMRPAGATKGRMGGFERLRRRFAHWVDRYAMIPDDKLRWAVCAFRPALRAIRRDGVDVIYSTSPPASVHLLARELKRRTGLPWVMDLRDPWTVEPLGMFIRDSRWRMSLERRLEGGCFERADLIIASTPEAAGIYRSIYSEHAGKIHAITNGFDEDEITAARALARENSFPGIGPDTYVVSHVGTLTRRLYEESCPEALLDALRRLGEEGLIGPGTHRVIFVGAKSERLRQRIDELGLGEIAAVTGKRPHSDALAIMARSNLLLLYDDSPSARTYVRGKLYEYLATGNRILGLVPEGATSTLLECSGHGAAVEPGDRDGVYRALKDAFGLRRKPEAAPGFDLESYERKNLALRLAAHLDGLTGPGQERVNENRRQNG